MTQINTISIKICINKTNPIRVMEIGGWDQPLLKKNNKFKYVGIDSQNLSLKYNFYNEFHIQSVEKKLPQNFNLIISRHVLEHIENNNKTFKNIYDSLNNNGYTFHYCPSKYHFYSILLRSINHKLQKILIKYLRPAPINHTGYKTYFSHCSKKELIKLLESIGFIDIQIKPYYKATDYFAFFVPFYLIVTLFENIFEFFSFSVFASGLKISAKKKIK